MLSTTMGLRVLFPGSLALNHSLGIVFLSGLQGVLNFLYGQQSDISPCFYQEAVHAATSLLMPRAKEYFELLLRACNVQLEATFSLHGLGHRFKNHASLGGGQQEDVENVCPERQCEEVEEEPGEEQYEYTIVSAPRVTPAHPRRLHKGQKRAAMGRPRGRPPKKKSHVAPQTVDPIRLKLRIGSKGKGCVENIGLSKTSEADGVAAVNSVIIQRDAIPAHTQPPKIPKYEYGAERKRKLAAFLPSCDICGKRFLRKGCIQRHKEKHHNGSKQRLSFSCDECPKQCPSRHDLKLHKRLHSGERPFKCGECGKAFTRKETLTEHEYTHKPDEEKPHQCPGCGKGFFKMHDLQRHYVGLHSGDKPFQCHLCGKSFPWARSLQDHISSHQGPRRSRPFKCTHCEMTFVRRYDLTRHSITHSKQKPYVCEWCGHAFTQKGSMDKHKRDFCRSRPGGTDYCQAEGLPGIPSGTEQVSAPSSPLICYV